VLDATRKRQAIGTETRVSADEPGIAVHVIPTDEELVIARDTVEVVERMEREHADVREAWGSGYGPIRPPAASRASASSDGGCAPGSRRPR